MSDSMKVSKTLFLEARNFGDAIIKNTLIGQYGAEHPDEQIDIWAKRQFADIFLGNTHIHKFYASGFPIAGLKSWNIIQLIKKIWALRKEKYDIAIDTVGDFRERLLLWLVHPKRIVSIEREKGHPFNQLIRRGLSFLVESVEVSADKVNYYDQTAYLLYVLGGQIEYNKTKLILKKKSTRVVGIHPFASQKCKMWSWDRWNALVIYLLKEGYQVRFFCSPKERSALEEHINFQENVSVTAKGVKDFFLELQQIDLLICLDSFAVHAAYSVSVPSIMLNGANNFYLWKTPATEVVVGDFFCKYWPCYNKPKCKDFRCMNAIQVLDVMKEINRYFFSIQATS